MITADTVRVGQMVNGATVTHIIDHPSGIAFLSFGYPIATGLKPTDMVEVS